MKSFKLSNRLRDHVRSFYGNGLDEFSAAYLCRETLLADLPKLCRGAIFEIGYLKAVLDWYAPDIICVMPHAGHFQQMAAALAKEHGIPVLACSAAWETGTSSAFRNHLHADKLATSGEKMRKMYVNSGLEPGRVVATGIAHFDGLFKRDAERDRQTLRDSGIDPDRNFVVFITDNLPMAESEALLTAVIDAIMKIEGMDLIVKVHPKEEADPFQDIIDRYNSNRLQVFKDINLYALLNCCRMVVSKGSTAALEAMIIDKPVIIFDLGGMPVSLPYLEEEAVIGVSRVEDLSRAIAKGLYDEKTMLEFERRRREFVRAWTCEPDGRASERIVALMKDMIHSGRAR